MHHNIVGCIHLWRCLLLSQSLQGCGQTCCSRHWLCHKSGEYIYAAYRKPIHLKGHNNASWNVSVYTAGCPYCTLCCKQMAAVIMLRDNNACRNCFEQSGFLLFSFNFILIRLNFIKNESIRENYNNQMMTKNNIWQCSKMELWLVINRFLQPVAHTLLFRASRVSSVGTDALQQKDGILF